MLSAIFRAFQDLNKRLDNNIVEISVMRSQMLFGFEDSQIIYRHDIEKLDGYNKVVNFSDIGCIENNMLLSFRGLNEDLMNSLDSDDDFKTLYSFILFLRDTICQCPALEYVASSNYIKIFLDVPNLTLKNLTKIDEFLGQEGYLELGAPRPYLLYVSDEEVNSTE